MQSKLFVLLFVIFIFSLTFSSNDKKRKRRTQKNILNPQEDYSQITIQSVPPSTDNLQLSDTIVSDLLNTQNVENSTVPSNLLNKLLENKNVFRYIFPYLSLFELELNFKCTSTTFYHLYEKFVQEEKSLLKEHLKNKTKFLENINYTRQYFDFFEKRHWVGPSRIEYVNVDCFSEDLVLFPKSIRQIIWFTFKEIEYEYVLFKNGHLSILKKLNKEGSLIFTSLEKDFENFLPNRENHLKLHAFQENVRCIEITSHSVGVPIYFVCLHKTNNVTQNIWHVSHAVIDHHKIIISESFLSCPRVFLKNFSGYLHGNEFVSLWKFEKQNNGIYKERVTHCFKTNVKKIISKDFKHYAEEVLFIFKTD